MQFQLLLSKTSILSSIDIINVLIKSYQRLSEAFDVSIFGSDLNAPPVFEFLHVSIHHFTTVLVVVVSLTEVAFLNTLLVDQQLNKEREGNGEFPKKSL